MAWQQLFDSVANQTTARFNNLPLVIAGPILRRTTAGEVSVWIALKAQRSLTLRIYVGSNTNPIASGSSTLTTALGANLHVAVIKVSGTFSPGTVYTYDIDFGSISTKFASAGVLTVGGSVNDIVFQSSGLARPSFSLPPTDINQLRLIHASCRKAHGENKDALEGLHAMIDDTFTQVASNQWANSRPHQLFLTGDQIYSDDVADAMLHMIMDASKALLKWTETMPSNDPTDGAIRPGRRAALVQALAKFTPETDACKSHLIKLGEFYSMYLFAFSPVLWDVFPPVKTDIVNGGGSVANDTVFTAELNNMLSFKNSLPLVRRALANVPVYMIMDDHEITDDWNITGEWVKDVYASAWGKRIISNGLTAYAIFQHWGNNPAHFALNKPGETLLAALGTGTPNFTTLQSKVLPVPNNASSPAIMQTPLAGMVWYYSIDMSPNYEVLVLDCRTLRGYLGLQSYPAVISRSNMDIQIPLPASSVKLTVVVSTGPLFGVPAVELGKNISRGRSNLKINAYDKEDWGFRRRDTVQFFMSCLARKRTAGSALEGKILLLGGDVHYGFSIRAQYWATSPLDPTDTSYVPNKGDYNMVIAQLTASSLKNEKHITPKDEHTSLYLHNTGYVTEFNQNFLKLPLKEYGYQVFGTSRSIGTQTPSLVYVPLPSSTIYAWEHPSMENWYLFNIPLKNGTGRTTQMDAPDWKCRIDYLEEKTGITYRPIGNTIPLNSISTINGTRQTLVSYFGNLSRNYLEYAKSHGNGREIVGKNNIGEILFIWPNTGNAAADDLEKKIIHRLWWQLYSETTTPATIAPRTVFEVRMGHSDTQFYPEP